MLLVLRPTVFYILTIFQNAALSLFNSFLSTYHCDVSLCIHRHSHTNHHGSASQHLRIGKEWIDGTWCPPLKILWSNSRHWNCRERARSYSKKFRLEKFVIEWRQYWDQTALENFMSQHSHPFLHSYCLKLALSFILVWSIWEVSRLVKHLWGRRYQSSHMKTYAVLSSGCFPAAQPSTILREQPPI